MHRIMYRKVLYQILHRTSVKKESEDSKHHHKYIRIFAHPSQKAVTLLIRK